MNELQGLATLDKAFYDKVKVILELWLKHYRCHAAHTELIYHHKRLRILAQKCVVAIQNKLIFHALLQKNYLLKRLLGIFEMEVDVFEGIQSPCLSTFVLREFDRLSD